MIVAVLQLLFLMITVHLITDKIHLTSTHSQLSFDGKDGMEATETEERIQAIDVGLEPEQE